MKELRVTSGNDDSHDWLELPDTYTKKNLLVVVKAPREYCWENQSKERHFRWVILIGSNCAKALESI